MIYAEHRSSTTQFELGQMFRKATDDYQHYDQAAKWYNLSARQGNIKAQYKLGLLYIRGLGVSINYIKAYAWLKIAASQGSGKAHNNLKKLSKKIPANQLNDAHKLTRKYYNKFAIPCSPHFSQD